LLGAALATRPVWPGNGDTEARRKKKKKRKKKQGSGSRNCAATCAGCCDGNGACQAGTDSAACGAGGATCTACTGEAVCGSGSCAVPLCGGSVPCRVFVTSTTHKGNLGGLAGADAICQALAAAAGLPGTYMAWLSDNPTSPATRFVHSAAPYRRVDGVTIADNFTDLTDASLDAPINVTETGAVISADVETWTSTKFDGTPGGVGSCSHWTNDTVIFTASFGNATSSNATWTTESGGGTEFCNQPHRLYCFQQS
jgi:hypothetical protein